jgi:hypothetical protein
MAGPLAGLQNAAPQPGQPGLKRPPPPMGGPPGGGPPPQHQGGGGDPISQILMQLQKTIVELTGVLHALASLAGPPPGQQGPPQGPPPGM